MPHHTCQRVQRRAAGWPAGLAILTIAGALSLPHVAHGQLPVTQLAYSAKFLCGYNSPDGLGVIDDLAIPYGCQEYTVIEVHNPHSVPVDFVFKVVRDPSSLGPSVIIVPPTPVTLGPNLSWEWSCANYPFTFGDITRGFVEVLTPMQLKVVALYKEFCSWGGLTKSASVAKKSSPPFFFYPYVRHSGTFLVGDDVTAQGDTIRHETTISLANLSPNPVSCDISIVDESGFNHTFPKLLQPNGFATVTGADLPAWAPHPFVGGVTVQYNDAFGNVALLECEEIIQKYVIAGSGAVVMGMDVVEVQPVPRR